MLLNQRLIADDGYEVMLFPMGEMYISQGEHGSLSHELAMDFLGWGSNGRIYTCPYYAPCSCHCVYNFGQDNATWVSDDMVHCADGSLQYVTFCFNHDASPPGVGATRTQGEIIGYTGTNTSGIPVGDHCHFNTANGTYAGYERILGVEIVAYELKNSNHIYDICYVNDTVMVPDHTGDYNWKTYEGGVTPPEPSPDDKTKHKFPWFIYARALRGETSV